MVNQNGVSGLVVYWVGMAVACFTGSLVGNLISRYLWGY